MSDRTQGTRTWVNEVADRFEREWAAGRRPRIEDYLADVAEPDRSRLLEELLRVECEIRARAGEHPTASDYTPRFPSDGGVIDAVLAGRAATTRPEQKECAVKDEAPPFPAGFVLKGRYTLERVLGRGGMGTVYLALDNKLGCPVALKVPRFDGIGDARLVERFYREARIAATFGHHPNLCPVFDVDQIDGIHYLTMPFLRGEPLSALLKREGPLPERAAMRFASLIARAMAHAHLAGFIHRDLKPANVMIDERHEPVVMDFGLARPQIPTGTGVTARGDVVGTPAYMPPEQAKGEPEEIGPACDIYGLGVTLYEMLTGRTPFRGGSGEVMRQVAEEEPPPPSHYRPGLDPRLDAICMTALAKEPGDRFSSMDGFADALDELRRERASRRPLAWLVLAGLLVASLGIIPLAARPRRDALQSGTRWEGWLYWKTDDAKYKHMTYIDVTRRDGPSFSGISGGNEDGKRYEDEIEGSVQGGDIRWRYTRRIRNDLGADTTGAIVEGKIAGGEINADYVGPDGDEARFHLIKVR